MEEATMTDIRDTLLVLSTYPDPTPDYIIDQAVAMARSLGANISALVEVLDGDQMGSAHSLEEFIVDVPALVTDTVGTSKANARRLSDRFEAVARANDNLGVAHSEQRADFSWPDVIAHQARLRDLTFLPVAEAVGFGALYAETAIFDAGRPIILLPAAGDKPIGKGTIENVTIGWDFSRAAARALADAFPILRSAKKVRIVTVGKDKRLDDFLTVADLERHLAAHGIKASFDSVDAAGRGAGPLLSDYAQAVDTDLLVMGAFGHSRMREFILGGATRTMLTYPPVPVFLSH
jgi:nucleotide-binding universal stress UspA family protein